MNQSTRDFKIGDAVATVGVRPDGTMWVSVLDKLGTHYQCDFIGDFDRGPVSTRDFMHAPPEWVVSLLDNQEGEPMADMVNHPRITLHTRQASSVSKSPSICPSTSGMLSNTFGGPMVRGHRSKIWKRRDGISTAKSSGVRE